MRSVKLDGCWINRFPEDLSDEYIARRVALSAQPIIDLGKNSPDADARKLDAGLKQVFVPTSGVCGLLRRLNNVGKAHAIEHFPNMEKYVSGLYQDIPPGTTAMPMCLTGQAGVGKSELLKAFGRMLGGFETLQIAGVDGIPNIPSWHMRVNERASINQLLLPILAPGKSSDSGHSDIDAPTKYRDVVTLLQKARRRAHRDGVCLAFADEFQFRTQSQSATALITKLLYQLWTLGPRLVFVSNFSLLHSLKKRPDQDRDRLLSNPMILHPHGAESEDWRMTLAELFRVAPIVFELDVLRDGDALHHYCFGVNRRLVDLLVLAYRLQHESKKLVVKLADIEKAQRSAEFSSHRDTVNSLIKQSITKTKSKDRPDLWCPFDNLDLPQVIHADVVVRRFDAKVQDDLLRSSLTPEERHALITVEGPLKKSKRLNNVLRMQRPKILTTASLIDGDASFDEMLLKTGPSPGPIGKTP